MEHTGNNGSHAIELLGLSMRDREQSKRGDATNCGGALVMWR